jgi:hypothetical protein
MERINPIYKVEQIKISQIAFDDKLIRCNSSVYVTLIYESFDSKDFKIVVKDSTEALNALIVTPAGRAQDVVYKTTDGIIIKERFQVKHLPDSIKNVQKVSFDLIDWSKQIKSAYDFDDDFEALPEKELPNIYEKDL